MDAIELDTFAPSMFTIIAIFCFDDLRFSSIN